MHPFTQKVIDVVARIPQGRVATYGQVAGLAGNPQAARQVARILHSVSKKHSLPWHRVVNRDYQISLPGAAGDGQRARLEVEGIRFVKGPRLAKDCVDISYRWAGF